MANRNFPSNKVYGFNVMPVRIAGSITIGAAGAVSAFSAPGVKAVTHDGTGVYKIQMQDNYNSFINLKAIASGSITGSALDPHVGVAGTIYQITLVGTTDWVTAGIPQGITPAVGQTFALAAQPLAGTGRVKAWIPSVVSDIEAAGSQSLMLQNQPFNAQSGGFVTMVCLSATDAATTTRIPADPASGDIIYFEILLNNSSVQ